MHWQLEYAISFTGAASEENAADLPADEKEEVNIFQTTFWLGAQNGWLVKLCNPGYEDLEKWRGFFPKP